METGIKNKKNKKAKKSRKSGLFCFSKNFFKKIKKMIINVIVCLLRLWYNSIMRKLSIGKNTGKQRKEVREEECGQILLIG